MTAPFRLHFFYPRGFSRPPILLLTGGAACDSARFLKLMSLNYLLSSQYILSPQFLSGEYFSLSIFFVVSSIISCPVSALSFFLSSRSADKEKISAYECGFSPFEDARNQFDVRYYSVAISFIISDLEVSFLFP